MKSLLVLVAIVAIGWYANEQYVNRVHRVELQSAPVEVRAPTESKATASYSCDGRVYCSQMTSCAEATFFINNCPGTKMDGNNDGVPCEKQWCR